MAKLARLTKRFSAGNARAIPAWSEPPSLSLITDIDAGNVSPSLSSVVNANTSSPTVNISVRVQGARHYHFAVENVEGKTPHFVVNRGRMESGSLLSTNIPVYTTDFETWTQVINRQLIGGTSGTIEFDTAPLPVGRIYFANAPLGRYIDSSLFVADMLANHSDICSPTSSADVNGVYNTTPTENDDIGRAVGGNSQYAIKLSWPDATNDGLRKRKLVVLTQIHAAGESQSWTTFLDSVDWMINSASAEANAFRDNWDVYIYMPVTANGLKGGNRRTNFRSAQDPNRDFVLSGNSNLVEITQLRAAIEADTGGECDLFYSWHGFNIYSDNYIIGVTPDDYNSGTRMPVAAHMITYGQTLFGSAPNIQTSGTNNTDCWWGYAKLGAKASFDVEVHGSGNTSRNNYTTIATNWMLMAVEADSQGLFVTTEIAGNAVNQAIATGTLTTEILLTGAAVTLATANAALTTSIDLAGVAVNVASATGDLGGSIALAGDATSETAASGALTTQISLSGDAIAQALASAGLDASILLDGSASNEASATGDLSGAAALQGAAAASATSSAALTTQIKLSGEAIAQALASASLDAGALLSGNAQAQSAATGNITTAIPLAGDISAVATGAGDLSTGIPLNGVAVSQAYASGDLYISLDLSGDALAYALAGASLTTQIPLSAAALANAQASGLLDGAARSVPQSPKFTVKARARDYRVTA